MSEYKEIQPPMIGLRTAYSKAYEKDDLRVWITRDVQGSVVRWHMSISATSRYPVWDEIREAWYALKPSECANVTMAMMLPPESEYVNIHPNCFHLHEVIE